MSSELPAADRALSGGELARLDGIVGWSGDRRSYAGYRTART